MELVFPLQNTSELIVCVGRDAAASCTHGAGEGLGDNRTRLRDAAHRHEGEKYCYSQHRRGEQKKERLLGGCNEPAGRRNCSQQRELRRWSHEDGYTIHAHAHNIITRLHTRDQFLSAYTRTHTYTENKNAQTGGTTHDIGWLVELGF